VKVTIVGGAGGVGASVAFNLLLTEGGHEVVIVDRRPEMIDSHVWDLEQVVEQRAGSSIRGGSDEDLLDADVLVIAAATPLTVNTSRLVYLADNAAIVADVVDRLRGAWDGWKGVVVMVTNPVDPLCTFFQRRTGFERRRLLGYTLNDSLRLRTGVARALGVEPGSVDAWVIGEHGDTSVPLFDRVRVGERPVTLEPSERAAAEDFIRTWYSRHVALDSGRSSTWTSGLGIARMVQAISTPFGELWPASIVLAGEYGIDGVSVSVPVTLGRGGAEEIHEWDLGPADLDALRRSAELVRELASSL
jgi:malate/lactate dehydrogenase